MQQSWEKGEEEEGEEEGEEEEEPKARAPALTYGVKTSDVARRKVY